MALNNNQVIDFSNNTPNLIGNVNNLVQSVVNQFIAKPIGSNLSGFVFDIIGDEEIALDAEVTDHYLEDNISIQDHVALRPEEFTLKGYVGELTDIIATVPLNVISNNLVLSTVAGFLPNFTAQAQQAYNVISNPIAQITSAYTQAQNFYNIFSQNSTTATKQQNGFMFFYNMWLSRTLFTVQTPFNVFPSPIDPTQQGMIIKSLRVLQRDDNRYVSDFSVTFKMIRTVQTTSTSATSTFNPLGSATQNVNGTPSLAGRYGDNSSLNFPTALGQSAGSTTNSSNNPFNVSLLGAVS